MALSAEDLDVIAKEIEEKESMGGPSPEGEEIAAAMHASGAAAMGGEAMGLLHLGILMGRRIQARGLMEADPA